MFRNCLAAALRNLVRNRLYAAINIAGLAIGFAAALLIGLYARDELSYDKWIPRYQDVYHARIEVSVSGQAPMLNDRIAPTVAGLIRQQFPGVRAVARISNFIANVGQSPGVQPNLRRGTMEAAEELYWADPAFFTVVPLPVVAGTLATALTEPDSIVLTRSLARKYFGADAPIGQTIDVDRQHPMRVTAVIEDLPSDSHFAFTALASGRASFSPLTVFETGPLAAAARNYQAAHTYFRMEPGVAPPDLQGLAGDPAVRPDGHAQQTFITERIDHIHLAPRSVDSPKTPGSAGAVAAMAVIALMIVAIASINFINLMAARGARRALEIGIRKVSGAERRQLMFQFMGEAMIYALLGMIAATVLASALLPKFNAFLDRTLALDYLRDGQLLAALLFSVLLVGFGAGAYPALILSGYDAGAALQMGKKQKLGSGHGQRGLVAFQFAVLLALMACGGVAWRQNTYATDEGMRLDRDAMMVVAGGCNESVLNQVRALAGVRGAACSVAAPLGRFSGVEVTRPAGDKFVIAYEPVDIGLLELYGVQPVAGRLFSADRGADAMLSGSDPDAAPQIVVNETAVRSLGYATPRQALGAVVTWSRTSQPAQIVGVVADFPLGSLRNLIPPTAFAVDRNVVTRMGDVTIKLAGRDIPETVAAIDRIWHASGPARPVSHFFVDDRVQALYADVIRQSEVFAAFAATALFIACLGLFGLAAFTAERRTKEIGIRKAMGASRLDIIRIMIWDFTKPVIWANAVAWPVGYLVMLRWLEGFAYHIDVEPWIFLASSAIALVIAVLTVCGHALMVSRAQPVTALRYE